MGAAFNNGMSPFGYFGRLASFSSDSRNKAPESTEHHGATEAEIVNPNNQQQDVKEYELEGFASLKDDDMEIEFEDSLAKEIDYESKSSGWRATDKWTKMLKSKYKSKSKPQVRLYYNKRETFNKLPFNENHIPDQSNYTKVRKNKP